MAPARKGDLIEAVVQELNPFAVGVARVGGLTLEIPKTLPGEKVKVRLEREFLQGKLWLCSVVSVQNPSPARGVSSCGFSGSCNGCALDFLSYAEQLAFKTRKVREFFPEALPVEGAEKTLYYRNAGRFSVEADQNRVTLGTYSKLHGELIALHGCKTCPEIFESVNRSLSEILNQNLKNHESWISNLKEVSYRYSFSENTLMILFYLKDPMIMPEEILTEIRARHPEAVSFYQALSQKKTGHLSRMAYRHVSGEKFLIDALETSEIKFRIFPDTLIYPNLFQGEKIYAYLLEKSGISGREKAADLSCGSGISALYLAKKARMVYGLEMDRFFVRDAVFNSRLNRMENVIFMEKEMEEFSSQKDILADHPAAVFVKPQGRGLHPSLIETFAQENFKTLIYTTSHLEILKQDSEKILGAGYVLDEVKGFDILPGTFHVEAVAVFHKKPKVRIRREKKKASIRVSKKTP